MGKKKHKQQILKYEVTGLAMLTAAGLALGGLGIVGRYLDVAFIYLAGSWSVLVPCFIAYAAVYMMWKRGPFPWSGRHMGLLVLFISWLTLMEFVFYQNIGTMYPEGRIPLFSATLTAVQDLRDLLLHPQSITQPAAVKAGGGLVGYAVFSMFNRLFSTAGTLFVLVICGILGVALVTEKSLVAGVQRGTAWMEKRLDNLWKGSMQYVSLLFGPETARKSNEKEEADREDVVRNTVRKGRRKPELIVDGEVLDDPPYPRADVYRSEPIIHDFATRVNVSESARDGDESSAPSVEQIGNQIVARYPSSSRTKKATVDVADSPSEPYLVGTPIHDENYQLPPLSLFTLPEVSSSGFSQRGAQENARKLETTLESFGVQAKVLEISRGPAVTRYEVQPAVGVKVSRIVSLTDDIALALAARDIRMEAPIPGKAAIGIEVPNSEVAVVTLREVLESPDFQSSQSKLSIAFGRDISGSAIVGNLQKMPHLLVAGATGSGKSVCINGIIASILVNAKPHEVKLLMIDPKMVELSGYNGIPHLLAPVVTDPRKASFALKKVVQEMENRYQLFADRGARDIDRYNQLLRADGLDELPFIVVIVDELADLMMVAPGEVEDAICRIAQMARAAGIHLIVATQRPSVDVITGVIKANIPSRIAFSVSSMADSRTILDSGGAEKLLGRGDMLYLPAGASKSVRVQGAYVSELEIEKLVEYVKNQQNAVYTVDLNLGDEASDVATESDLDTLFIDAMDLVVESGQASVSMLQRRFRIGYSRAARIVDQMELQGLVGRFEGSKPREVLVSREQWAAMKSSFVVENHPSKKGAHS